ncbi:MAG: preprotein translocase subunit SecF [Phenylobacterium sp.]|jgi:preprotein translocase subunit SecF
MNNQTLSTQSLSKWRYAGFKVAIVLMTVALLVLITNGLNLGIDFTGGMITRFATSETLTVQQMHDLLDPIMQGAFNLGSANNGSEWMIQQPATLATQHYKEWLDALAQSAHFEVNFMDSNFIGPQVGDELIDQGGLAMLASLVAIMLYLAARFEWRLAVGSIIALFHDVLVVLGIFALFGLEFNLTVLAALLAVIGYSLNDSIIVADRIRELMRMNKNSPLDNIVNAAIASTMSRTLITSGTTLATVGSVWMLAGRPLEGFSVSLFVGIMVGTLSSICISATVPGLIGLDVDYYKRKIAQRAEEMNS